MRVRACFHLCLSAELPDRTPHPPPRPPPLHPITVRTLGLNTNTAYCLSAYSCHSPHPHGRVYIQIGPALSVISVKGSIHFQRRLVMTLGERERMAGFPCKQGNSAISLFSNGRVLTKHSCVCLCGGFTQNIPGAPALPDYLAKVGLTLKKKRRSRKR